MITFTNAFRRRFSDKDIMLVESIYARYFESLIDRDVGVGYTSGRVLGIADIGAGIIRIRKMSPHTVAHELMHLAQYNARNKIPKGERSCEVYTCALGEDVCDHAVYIRTNSAPPSIIYSVCKEAIEKRSSGFRNYISWAEKQFAR